MDALVKILPHVNASLNGLATLMLVAGLVLIRRGHEAAHRRAMLGCFGISALFLVCYVVYHTLKGGSTPFTGQIVPVRYFYYSMLLSHVVLAAAVPFLAIWTIRLGLKNDRKRHRRWAKITFPIWFYVSLTGVLVYVMLYHLADKL